MTEAMTNATSVMILYKLCITQGHPLCTGWGMTLQASLSRHAVTGNCFACDGSEPRFGKAIIDGTPSRRIWPEHPAQKLHRIFRRKRSPPARQQLMYPSLSATVNKTESFVYHSCLPPRGTLEAHHEHADAQRE